MKYCLWQVVKNMTENATEAIDAAKRLLSHNAIQVFVSVDF